MKTKGQKFSSTLESKKKRRRNIILAFFVINIIIVFALFGQINNFKTFKIKNINITGNQTVNNADIQKIISESISGKYLWYLNKDSFISYPKDKIVSQILMTIPKIDSVSISTKDYSLNMKVKEREKQAIWCNDNKVDCYFMDKNGFIFTSADNNSFSDFIVYFGNNGIDSNKIITSYYKPMGDFYNFKIFVDELIKRDFKIVKAISAINNDIELITEKNMSILIKKNQDLNKIILFIDSLISGDDIVLKENIYSAKYLDLRFDNKIYYRK